MFSIRHIISVFGDRPFGVSCPSAIRIDLAGRRAAANKEATRKFVAQGPQEEKKRAFMWPLGHNPAGQKDREKRP